MTNSAVEAVFGAAPANIDLSQDTRPGNDAAVIILLVIATVALFLRMAARSVAKAGVKSDDWLMVLALLFTYGTAGMTLAGGAYGAGTHVWALTIHQITITFKILYGYTFIYAAAVSSTKISILLFYRRIFQRNAGLFFQVCLGFGGFLATSYPIVVWATMASACQPRSYFWARFSGAGGACIDINTFFLALGVINMINDIIVLLIPIPQIWKLNMRREKRLGVIGILLLGSFVCVASIVRIHYLAVFLSATDVTYVVGPVFIWSSVEPSVGILSACLPTFPPLIRLVRGKGKGNTGASYSVSEHLAAGVSGARRRAKSTQQLDGRTFLQMEDDECELTSYICSGCVGDGEAGDPENQAHTDSRANGITVQSSIDQNISHRNSPVPSSHSDLREPATAVEKEA